MPGLTAAEVRRHSEASSFSAVFAESGLVMSWVHTRGRLEKGSGDSGKHLVMMSAGGFPQVLLSGEAGVSGAVFSPSGKYFAF